MKEFISELEKLQKADELNFAVTPGFGRYAPFLSQAIPHPAKANTKLLEFLIKQFTEEGETILDPMMGSGSTLVVASLLGRNAVGVDIEEKFVDWAEEAKRKVVATATLTPKGAIRNICGDARKLSFLLKEPGTVISSHEPLKILDVCCGRGGWSAPFIEDGDEVYGIDIKNCGYPGQLILQDIRTIDGHRFKNFDLIIGSPPCEDFSDARYRSVWIHKKKPNPSKGFELIEEFWRIVREAQPKFYAMENIQALTKYYQVKPNWHFMISKGGKRCLWTNIPIPLSPQFRFAHRIRDIPGWDKTRPDRAKIPYPVARFIANCLKQAIENLTKTARSCDAIVTSPPYGHQVHGKHSLGKDQKYKDWKMPGDVKVGEGYSNKAENIGNLPHGNVDAVITSPPYGEAQDGHGIAKDGYRGKKHSPTDLVGNRSYMPDKFESPENISRLPFDAVITSPPYSESLNESKNTTSNLKREERLRTHGHKPKEFFGGTARNCQLENGLRYSHNPENIGNLSHGNIDAVITSPPYTNRQPAVHTPHLMTNKKDMDKISKVPHGFGNVDAVITSPPYSEQLQAKADYEKRKERLEKEGFTRETHGLLRGQEGSSKVIGGDERYSDNPQNIGNLPHGEIDAVITSPPYSDIAKSKEGAISPHMQGLISKLSGIPVKEFAHNVEKLKEAVKIAQSKIPFKYSDSSANIGNLPFDAVITSPPYEGSLEGSTRHTKGGIASRDPALAQTGTYATRLSFGVPVGYSSNTENIGNLKKETYLEAMLKVYQECWKVLKENGLAIIIIKPFIRNKQVVDLPFHTWLLLERVGFKLTKLFKLRLKQESFWRILYKKKYPNVPEIKHEYILVCRKP